jgi:hypothetical protein
MLTRTRSTVLDRRSTRPRSPLDRALLGSGATARRKARTMMRRIGLTALALVVCAVGATVGPATPVRASNRSDVVRQDGLAGLRRATSKYHDLDAAIASGRVDLHACVDHMGQHYADPLKIDGVQDPLDPEAMVYADDGRGHLRLVAVEWISPTPGFVGDRPLHFNPTFGVWILHAWIWSPNPDGMFADMNPRLGNCP